MRAINFPVGGTLGTINTAADAGPYILGPLAPGYHLVRGLWIYLTPSSFPTMSSDFNFNVFASGRPAASVAELRRGEKLFKHDPASPAVDPLFNSDHRSGIYFPLNHMARDSGAIYLGFYLHNNDGTITFNGSYAFDVRTPEMI